MDNPSLMRCEYQPAGTLPFRVLTDHDDDDEADDDDDEGPSLHRREHWRQLSESADSADFTASADFGSPQWWFRA